jgi:hypothetical protein
VAFGRQQPCQYIADRRIIIYDKNLCQPVPFLKPTAFPRTILR